MSVSLKCPSVLLAFVFGQRLEPYLLMGPVYKAMDAAKPVQKGKRGKKKEVKKKVGLAAVDLRAGADV